MTETLVLTYPKRPHFEGRFHTCSVCGREDHWDENWRWYGSWKDIDDGNPVWKTCSDLCWEMLKREEGISE